MRDGRRIEVYGGVDKEGQNVDYYKADSKRATQKWKLVYADKVKGIQSKGNAGGF
jgi:hypothetical protein